MTTISETTGNHYNHSRIKKGDAKPGYAVFSCWSNGEIDIPGHREEDYWDNHGKFLGPDCEGIEPIYTSKN